MPQLPQIDSVKAPDKIVAQATRARRFPWLNIPFILVVALLVSYGLVVVMSAVANDRDYSFTNQLAGVALGIVFMVLVWRFDYRRLSDFTMLFLIVNVALILSPHIPGLGTDAGMGAQSWLKLGIQVQPGEFAKITVILLDASIMARYGGRLDDPREYVKALGLMLVPFACIMTQPDLGTGLVYLCIGAVALVVGGARPKYLLITLAAFVAAVIAVFVVDQIIYNSNISATACSCSLIPTSTLRARATTSSRLRSPSGRAACSARACSRERSIRWASCPRLPPTSSSACWPRNWGF